MSPETALTVISIVGAVGTTANVYLTLTIKVEILKLRNWVSENYVHKDDMRSILNMGQMRDSAQRVTAR